MRVHEYSCPHILHYDKKLHLQFLDMSGAHMMAPAACSLILVPSAFFFQEGGWTGDVHRCTAKFQSNRCCRWPVIELLNATHVSYPTKCDAHHFPTNFHTLHPFLCRAVLIESPTISATLVQYFGKQSSAQSSSTVGTQKIPWPQLPPFKDLEPEI